MLFPSCTRIAPLANADDVLAAAMRTLLDQHMLVPQAAGEHGRRQLRAGLDQHFEGASLPQSRQRLW